MWKACRQAGLLAHETHAWSLQPLHPGRTLLPAWASGSRQLWVQIPVLQGQVSLSSSRSFLISTMEEKEYQTMRAAVSIKSNMTREVPSKGPGSHSAKETALFVSAVLLPLARSWEPPGLLCHPYSPLPPLPSFLYTHPLGPPCVLLRSEIRLRKTGRGVGDR